MPKIIKAFNVCVGEPAIVEEPEALEKFQEFEEEKSEADDCINELRELPEEECVEFAKQKAEEIIHNALMQSKKVYEEHMNKVDEEREIVIEQAKRNGFEEGYNQVLEKYEEMIHEAGEIKIQAKEEYDELINNAENDILEIVFDIVKKVIGSGPRQKDEVLYLVKSAIEACTHKEHILIKVSEEDYEIIIKEKNKLLAMVRGIGEVEIKLDHSLKSGGCLIETPFGSVDGSLDTKIEEIKKCFKGLVEK